MSLQQHGCHIDAVRRVGAHWSDSTVPGPAYESAGRFGDAIAVFSGALADRERGQGAEHPDTLAARGNLAHAYLSARTVREHLETASRA